MKLDDLRKRLRRPARAKPATKPPAPEKTVEQHFIEGVANWLDGRDATIEAKCPHCERTKRFVIQLRKGHTKAYMHCECGLNSEHNLEDVRVELKDLPE